MCFYFCLIFYVFMNTRGMCVLLGKKKKKITNLPTLFFSSPLRQYNLFIFDLTLVVLPWWSARPEFCYMYWLIENRLIFHIVSWDLERCCVSLFKDVLLRTRRTISPLTLYSNSTLLVLNGTSLNIDSALLALPRRYAHLSLNPSLWSVLDNATVTVT